VRSIGESCFRGFEAEGRSASRSRRLGIGWAMVTGWKALRCLERLSGAGVLDWILSVGTFMRYGINIVRKVIPTENQNENLIKTTESQY
jgi:hypothetical protein